MNKTNIPKATSDLKKSKSRFYSEFNHKWQILNHTRLMFENKFTGWIDKSLSFQNWHEIKLHTSCSRGHLQFTEYQCNNYIRLQTKNFNANIHILHMIL